MPHPNLKKLRQKFSAWLRSASLRSPIFDKNNNLYFLPRLSLRLASSFRPWSIDNIKNSLVRMATQNKPEFWDPKWLQYRVSLLISVHRYNAAKIRGPGDPPPPPLAGENAQNFEIFRKICKKVLKFAKFW